MIIKDIKKNFEDNRGIITDIITKERIDYVTIITNKKGSVRGNHYHKETIQYLYVIEGSNPCSISIRRKRNRKENFKCR